MGPDRGRLWRSSWRELLHWVLSSDSRPSRGIHMMKPLLPVTMDTATNQIQGQRIDTIAFTRQHCLTLPRAHNLPWCCSFPYLTRTSLLSRTVSRTTYNLLLVFDTRWRKGPTCHLSVLLCQGSALLSIPALRIRDLTPAPSNSPKTVSK
jgi:hypothetical protein